MLSQLQLKQHSFTSIHLDTNENGSVDAPILISTNIEGGEDKTNPYLLSVKLTVILESDTEHPCAYTGKVEIIGQFEVAKDFDITKRLDVMRVNAVSLLYGAVREMVMTITARSANGMLCIPTLSFIDLPSNIEKIET